MPLIFGRVLASGIMVPVNVDTDGDPQIDIRSALPAGTNNIGDVDVITLPSIPAGSNLIGDVQARSKGWVSSAWQKDPLRIGYSGVIRGSFYNTNLSAGTNNIDGTAVPAGEIWIVERVNISYFGTAGTVALAVHLVSSAVAYGIFHVPATITSGVNYYSHTYITLAPGENLRMVVFNATAGDDAYFQYVGMRVDIDQ